MTTQLDAQIGFKKESVFGTAVTVDSFVEFTAEDLTWQPTFAQGSGMRVGQRLAYNDRRVLVKQEVGGSFTVEGQTKGLGKLFEAALGGTGTSTQIGATAAYQQLFTPTTTDYLNSYTIQKGIPPLGGGATNPMTFTGMVCSGFTLEASNAAIPTVQFNWMGKGIDTATALATASYPSGVAELSFIHGAITIGGSVTVPTTTALASGGTATANVRDISLTWDNGLDSDGFNFGGAGSRSRKPALGLRSLTGSMTVEYDSNTLRDAWLNQTDLALVLTFQTTTAIAASNFPTLQVVVPVIRLEGDIPQANAGGVVTQSINFTGMDGRTAAHPVYVAIVTAETAI
jgi:hypothetical protein